MVEIITKQWTGHCFKIWWLINLFLLWPSCTKNVWWLWTTHHIIEYKCTSHQIFVDIVKNILADWKKHGKFLYEDIPPFITSSD